ncbi:hypothetical protein [Herbaspirillum sp. alder98]|uniref:hypothetical protein n=1 Tax=Herbaspirillum sp. alder98 TaxID=2913096 RepID=UPI001CD896F5|nr:hypothetical protein [Herbaspirillum sp. alder98]MCA1325776.1 hypothetical protein [Herbaspirillum sp. alder98]
MLKLDGLHLGCAVDEVFAELKKGSQVRRADALPASYPQLLVSAQVEKICGRTAFSAFSFGHWNSFRKGPMYIHGPWAF